MRGGLKDVRRVTYDRALAAPTTQRYDFLAGYADDLGAASTCPRSPPPAVRIGADPLGGASVAYWAYIGERYGWT